MAAQPLPSIAEIRQLLRYDPETGLLWWLPRPEALFKYPGAKRPSQSCKRWNARYAGTKAGANDHNGYVLVKIHDRSYPAHRLIWAMVHGKWPETIDHINGIPSDNRLTNLRDVSREINQRNQRRHKSNKSGRTGIFWSEQYGAWLASIKMRNVSHVIGVFDDFDKAVAARKLIEQKNGFTGRQT